MTANSKTTDIKYDNDHTDGHDNDVDDNNDDDDNGNIYY